MTMSSYTDIGGKVLYANDSMDITKDIVDGLNKIYRQRSECEC